MKYKWNSRKQNRVQHICNDQGFTYCKAENGSWRFDTISENPHPSRPTCNICKHMLATHQTPKLHELRAPKIKGKIRDLFLHTWEWKQVRYTALKQSNGKCQCCGRGAHDGVVLNVDHIEPRKSRPDLALTLSNLQVLCGECNHGKGNWDSTDWRHEKMDAEFKAVVEGQ